MRPARDDNHPVSGEASMPGTPSMGPLLPGSKREPDALEQLTRPHLAETYLLSRINEQLNAIGERHTVRVLPYVEPEVQAMLSGRRVVLVDDSPNVLSSYIPVLTVATSGSGVSLLHRSSMGQADLVKKIRELDPELLLLDYFLAGKVTGVGVLREVKPSLPRCIIIGFSTDPERNAEMVDAGADGGVSKLCGRMAGHQLEACARIFAERRLPMPLLSVDAVQDAMRRSRSNGPRNGSGHGNSSGSAPS